MRIVSVIGVALAGLLLASCASTGRYIGEALPEWAGGLPADAPPRRGEPGYQAYIRQIDGDEPAKAAPAQAAAAPAQSSGAPARITAATAPSAPPAKPQEIVDQPIH